MWRAAGAQVIEEQADKPANKRQVLRALVALSFYRFLLKSNNNKQF
jgi:hypothetical protein